MFLKGAKLFAFEKFKQKISALRNEQKYLILFVDHNDERGAQLRTRNIPILLGLVHIYCGDYALIVDLLCTNHYVHRLLDVGIPLVREYDGILLEVMSCMLCASNCLTLRARVEYTD